MLTNMENQLREQGASDKFDQVLEEIPRVRKDLGYIPLVTPTSQIVGTQAVLNVLSGDRYKTVTKETMGILKGEYGATPAKLDEFLQAKILDGAEVITCRPADNIEPEIETLSKELKNIAAKKEIKLADNAIDDILTYALFPQVALNFFENRDNPAAFEPVPSEEDSRPAVSASPDSNIYTITVSGQPYVVQVNDGGDITKGPFPVEKPQAAAGSTVDVPCGEGEPIPAPLSGQIFRVLVSKGQQIKEGDVVIILEAMKMETEIRASKSGTITELCVKEGDTVSVGDSLLKMAYQ
jgi:oxaloacetate decarboxylase (Na+ extruding) subunit alpha